MTPACERFNNICVTNDVFLPSTSQSYFRLNPVTGVNNDGSDYKTIKVGSYAVYRVKSVQTFMSDWKQTGDGRE